MSKELVTRKESVRWPGLFVKKYTRKVFYDNLWHQNVELMEARGHVETADGHTVIRPFTKIFNRFENNTDIDPDEVCISVRKVNGFMAAATWVPEVVDVVISTTGSLDSDFVTLAEKYLNEDVQNYIKSMSNIERGTFLFEIVDPSDPHIVPEEAGAYLIGFRSVDDDTPYHSGVMKEMNLDRTAKAMGVMRPHWKIQKFGEIVSEAAECKHEGFVVYGLESGKSLKIKSPYYLHLKMAARKKDIMSLNKERIDEEYYPLVNYIASQKDYFNSLDEQSRLHLMRDFLNR
jgi:hypothetical protein